MTSDPWNCLKLMCKTTASAKCRKTWCEQTVNYAECKNNNNQLKLWRTIIYLGRYLMYPKNPDPSKMATLRTLTPASYRFFHPSIGGSLGILRVIVLPFIYSGPISTHETCPWSHGVKITVPKPGTKTTALAATKSPRVKQRAPMTGSTDCLGKFPTKKYHS